MPFKVRVELSNGRSVGPRRAVRRVRFVLVLERRKGIKKCSSGPTAAAAAEYDVAALVYLVLLPLGGEGPRPHRVRLRRKVHIIGSGSAELGGQTGQHIHLTIATALWLLLYHY